MSHARAAKRRAAAGPPNFPTPKGQAASQDSFGNPTTKRAGDTGTQVGRKGRFYDMAGAHKPKGTRDWRKRGG